MYHLFRCHEGLDGYPAGFEDRLSNLMRGFTRVLTQRDQDNGADISKGKDAMSVDLYYALCRWFLEQGTMEGNRWTDKHTLESANKMFRSAANLFVLEDNAARHI